MATSQDVIIKVREIAAEFPDRIYNTDEFGRCLYTQEPDGSPGGCIVGRALMAVGVDPITLACSDPHPARLVVPNLVESDNRDVSWLQMVQQYQDDGRTWGESVTKADANMRYIR